MDVFTRYQDLAEILQQTETEAVQLAEDGVWYCQAIDRCQKYLIENEDGCPHDGESLDDNASSSRTFWADFAETDSRK